MSELNKDEFDKLMKELSKETEDYNIFSSLLYKPMKIEMPEPEPDNTQFRFMSRMWGMPIYTSNHAYQTVTKVRGIPSKSKPNSRRPLYRNGHYQSSGIFSKFCLALSF